ncbi:MAG: replicative DNA helicase [Gammaproteobacteria bacterium]|jgi:replicative DNA helicase|nr:replicative DNA helicase [Gammaproteobacteria bacterium]
MSEITTRVAELSQRVEDLKVPPYSLEAEQSVIGGLMLVNRAWDDIADIINEQDFYHLGHGLVLRSINALSEEGQPYDVVTVSEWLGARGELESIGGLAYLSILANDTPTAVNIKAYANIVREYSILRSLIQVGNEISASAYNSDGKPSKQLVDEAERKVFQIADQRAGNHQGFEAINELLGRAVKRVEEMYRSDTTLTGIATGFNDFDAKTSGLQKSDLIIVAGRPSMGKTSFAMNLAENAALHNDNSVAVFSMEMPGEQLALRMMSSLGRIDSHSLRTGKLDDQDWPRLISSVSMLSKAKLFIDDTASLTPTDLRARTRRLKREHGLDLVIVDYLQLMQVGGSTENRATEISEISRSLKALAKELEVPIVALSQLNRSVEQRPDKRPVMSDLRESGSIEQDADVILFIYRDEVYNDESPDKGTAEIIIRKQRNGPIGTVRLSFLGQYTRFENLAHDDYGGRFE